MSDDEFYSDDEDYFFFDDAAVDDVGDLAEHTMHSPVWQDDEPVFAEIEDISDWEYYSDDFYDYEPAKKRRKVHGSGDSVKTNNEGRQDAGTPNVEKCKQRLRPTEQIPALFLGEPVNGNADEQGCTGGPILWRSGFHSDDIPLPIAIDGQGETVALLTDWRVRFKTSPVPTPSIGHPYRVKRKDPKQTMVAVVISMPKNHSDPKVGGSSEKSHIQTPKISKRVHFAPSPNDTSDELTKPQKRFKPTSKVNGSTPPSTANSITNKSTKTFKRASKHNDKPNDSLTGTQNGSTIPSIVDDTPDETTKSSKRILMQPLKANGTALTKANGAVTPSIANDTPGEMAKSSKRGLKPTTIADGTISSKARAVPKATIADVDFDPTPKSTNLRKRRAPSLPEPHSLSKGTEVLDLQSNGTAIATRKRLKKSSS